MASYNLRQKKILITREEKQAKLFADQVRNYNGIPILAPLLKIDRVDRNEQKNIYHQLDKYEWIFFTSANGVNHFINQLTEDEKKSLVSISIATVGHKTDAALKKLGFEAKFIPSVYNAEVMADEFFNKYEVKGPILLVRGNIARNVLPKRLAKENIPFDSIVVYETISNMEIKDDLNNILHNEDIDFLTFTSPSTVEAFIKMTNMDYRNRICVTIGTTTGNSAEKYDFDRLLVPKEFTIEGMIQSMSDYLANEKV